jgi:GNAT superfamily N-acetyltransferase
MRDNDDTSMAEIRRSTLEDASAVSAVLLESFEEFRGLYTPGGFAATTPTPSEIAKRIAEGPLWVGVQGDSIVGTISAVIREDAMYVRGMGIVPAARGSGLAMLLLEGVEREARRYGCPQLLLSTTPFLIRAIRLYERFGFERTHTGPTDLFGTPLLTMAKPLVPLPAE